MRNRSTVPVSASVSLPGTGLLGVPAPCRSARIEAVLFGEKLADIVIIPFLDSKYVWSVRNFV